MFCSVLLYIHIHVHHKFFTVGTCVQDVYVSCHYVMCTVGTIFINFLYFQNFCTLGILYQYQVHVQDVPNIFYFFFFI